VALKMLNCLHTLLRLALAFVRSPASITLTSGLMKSHSNAVRNKTQYFHCADGTMYGSGDDYNGYDDDVDGWDDDDNYDDRLNGDGAAKHRGTL